MVVRERFRWLVVLVALIAACGGRSVRYGAEEEEPFEPGSGGSTGTAGGTGGTAGTQPPRRPPEPDPPTLCVSDGTVLVLGQRTTLADGCTVCTCQPWGLECLSDGCEERTECQNLADEYERALTSSSWCGIVNLPQYEPNSVCQAVALSTPDCGCPVVVRGTLLVDEVVRRYRNAGCTNNLCPPCPPLPSKSYYCAGDGFCAAH